MCLLELKAVSFGYQAAIGELFDELSLQLRQGECHLIHGSTGSGKSTLLKLLVGVLSRPFSGERVCQQPCSIGVVMQDPNVQLLRQTVGAEVAFALENSGVPSNKMIDLVAHALRQAGLYVALNTPIANLSLGQRYRLMIAAQLVSSPQILLLDEPWAQLDNQGVDELTELLLELQRRGMAIVIVEHHRGAFSQCVTYRWMLSGGKLTSYQPCDEHVISVDQRPGLHGRRDRSLLAPVVVSKALTLQFNDSKLLFHSSGLNLYPGEVVALIGDNGSGKSTLLKALAGIQSDIGALDLNVLGVRPKLGRYGASLALLHQRPSRQLFESTVIEEMQFSLKRYGLPIERGICMLTKLGLSTLANLSPHTLSYGQQHLVALASLACLQPKLLLLDDPFAGLDSRYVDVVVDLINELSQQGCAILLSNHRVQPQLAVDHYWCIAQQRLRCYRAESLAGEVALKRCDGMVSDGYQDVG